MNSFILHDDHKPLTRWLQSQDNYAKLEALKLLDASSDSLRLQDRLRCALVPAVPLALLYTLLVKGTVLDGWRGWDKIEIYLPHAERHDLITELRSLTQGLATFTAAFSHMIELTGRRADDAMAARRTAA